VIIILFQVYNLVCVSVGKFNSESIVNEMMEEASGPINFTMFLTLFGMKLNGTDSEETLVNSFLQFDEKATGLIPEEIFRECLVTMGDRFTEDEVNFVKIKKTKNRLSQKFVFSLKRLTSF
jgi:Ca2+-binding EF-hand superfamily protein